MTKIYIVYFVYNIYVLITPWKQTNKKNNRAFEKTWSIIFVVTLQIKEKSTIDFFFDAVQSFEMISLN